MRAEKLYERWRATQEDTYVNATVIPPRELLSWVRDFAVYFANRKTLLITQRAFRRSRVLATKAAKEPERATRRKLACAAANMHNFAAALRETRKEP